MIIFNPAIQSHNQSISIRTTYRDASFYEKGLLWRTLLQITAPCDDEHPSKIRVAGMRFQGIFENASKEKRELLLS